MIVVSNATALIHLSRIDKLSLLEELFSKVIIPRAVYFEVAVPGEVGYERIVKGIQEGWLKIINVRNRDATNELAPLLHRGEAEAIVLSEEARADYLIVDERMARRIAVSRGIKVIGILGLLALGVELQIIDINEALELGQALIESGCIIDPEVYKEWRRSLAERGRS